MMLELIIEKTPQWVVATNAISLFCQTSIIVQSLCLPLVNN